MQTLQTTNQNTLSCEKRYTADFIFVVQLHNGDYVISSANNPSKKIASLNTGFFKAVPKSLQVNRIVGIRDWTEGRTLMSVVKTFCEKYGDDRIIVV